MASSRAERVRTVLLMWEYGCDHSPVWARSGDLDVGPLDVASLGVEDGLREDLAAWNAAIEVAANPNDLPGLDEGPDWWRAMAARAFALAARLQRALGADWTVWCAAGDGDGFLRGRDAEAYWRAHDGRARLVLRTSALTVLIAPTAGHAPLLVPAALRAEVRAWTGLADRVAVPGFDHPGTIDPGEHRARGLELAGRLQAALPGAQVLWFGGEDVPG